MAGVPPEAFISYSREDAEFVDRMEADLRALDFDVWVDRRRIEGGREWEHEITSAIERYSLVIAVLSPPAVRSPHVRFEHELALRLDKRIVPVLYRPCPIPSALEKYQWIDFSDGTDYARALKELVYASLDPTFDLAADSDTLYNQALALKESDPERTTILFQRILDRNPGYFNGHVATEQQQLVARLYTSRVERLKALAEKAHRQGEYGVEAGALEAIIALGDQDPAVLAWAQEYLPVARQNRVLLGPYRVVLHLAASGNRAAAAEKLQILWQQAPYFRDPAGVAPELGLTVPMTYEEARDRRLADDQRKQREACADSDWDATLGRMNADMQEKTRQTEDNWKQACALMQSNLSTTTAEALIHHLEQLEALPSSIEMQQHIQDLPRIWRERQNALVAVNAAAKDVERAWTVGTAGAGGCLRRLSVGCLGFFSFSFGMTALALFVGAVGVSIDPGSTPQTSIWALWGMVVFEGVQAAIFAWLTILAHKWPKPYAERKKRKLDRLREMADGYLKEAERLSQAWLREAEPLYAERMQKLIAQHQRTISEAETRYRQRMAEIATEHRRAIVEISQRYR